jgi:phage shock protein PspC (stress-responsive transcriptional regulator)
MDADRTGPDHRGMATDDEPTTTEAQPPRPSVRRLYRSRTDKVVAGVAGGIGEHLGVDPVIIRIAFVALTVAGGSGLILYALGWLLLPEKGEGEAPGAAAFHSLFHRRPIIAIIVVIIGVSMLLDGFDWGRRDHSFGWAVGLVAIGAVILVSQRRRDGGGDHRDTDEVPPPPPTPGTDDWMAYATPLETTAVEFREPKPRSFLTPVTISLLLIGGGLASLFGASLQAYLAAALLTVGAALLIGSRVGQARGLIFVGLLLTGAATLASVTDITFAGGVGDRTYHPLTEAAVRPTYRLGVGEMQLDLSDVDFTRPTTEVRARLGVGSVQVLVPDDVDVLVFTHVGLGQVEVFGQHDDGGGIDRRFTRSGRGETARQLVLELRTGIGEIDVEVDRAAA